MKTDYKLEICCGSPTSALHAQQAGASRIELCQNLEYGGITPSYAQIKRTRELIDIGLFVLIRPRIGDFLYSSEEFEEMKEDIFLSKQLGCDGVVIGILDAHGCVDKKRVKELIEVASPMTAVFHRAFDLTMDVQQALEDIIDLGCQRILTSGQRNTALQGVELIRKLVEQAHGRIEIMPGAGVNSINISDIILQTGVHSIHSSAKVWLPSKMQYLSPTVSSMNESIIAVQQEQVMSMVDILKSL